MSNGEIPACEKCGSRDVRRFGRCQNGKQRYRCGCGAAFIGKQNYFPKGIYKRELYERACLLFRAGGYSHRVVAKILGIYPATARTWKRTIPQSELGMCPCGQDSAHRGWCWWRVKQSSNRQRFLKLWGKLPSEEIVKGIYDLPAAKSGRRDGAKVAWCKCGCNRPCRAGWEYVKGHEISKEERVWLLKGRKKLKEIKELLRHQHPWQSPRKASKPGATSQTA